MEGGLKKKKLKKGKREDSEQQTNKKTKTCTHLIHVDGTDLGQHSASLGSWEVTSLFLRRRRTGDERFHNPLPYLTTKTTLFFKSPTFLQLWSPQAALSQRPAAHRDLPPHPHKRQKTRRSSTIPRTATHLLPPPSSTAVRGAGTGSGPEAAAAPAGPAEGGSHLRSLGTVTP